jgi:murein DD-endopeptidase MepM/ murein hydrolase activator NlpD
LSRDSTGSSGRAPHPRSGPRRGGASAIPAHRRIARRVAGGLTVALVAGGLGLGGVVWAAPADEKSRVDQRLQEAQQRLGAARGKERVLTDEVSAYGERIRLLETRLAPLRARTRELQAELAGLQERLRSLNARLGVERRRLARAEALLATRQRLLAARLRDIYVRGEPDPIVMLIESRSFSAAVETADIFDRVVEADNGLVKSVKRHADAVRRSRDQIAAVRADVAASEARTAEATRESIDAKAELERQRAAQADAREGRRQLLERVQGDRADLEAETAGLQARSAALAAQIVAAQSGSSGSSAPPAPSGSVSTGGASSAGLAWPVHGTLTSNFGMRWGRMHEGIDIAGGSGTPIGAAAAGTVIVAGQQSGYGNIVVVDHGNGLSTAYAHLSSISVGVGQSVGQGTVIGGMGTTGHSTGVHLHFEVRVNGAPANPLNYL